MLLLIKNMTDKTKNILLGTALAIIAIAYWSMVIFAIKKSNEPIKESLEQIETLKKGQEELEAHNTLMMDYVRIYGVSAKKVIIPKR